MTNKLFPLAAALICAGLCIPYSKAFTEPVPFACNLNALTADGRKQLHALIGRMSAAIVSTTELKDGYALHIDAARLSFTEAAQWISLERKCCPFFDFQLDLPGGNGNYSVALKGREGVKEFIRSDFASLSGKLSNTM